MSCIWDTERGFGERSWRYSAVINDCKVEKIFVEVPFLNSHCLLGMILMEYVSIFFKGGGVVQNSGPDPFEVSDADTMVKYLQSKK